MQKNYKDCWQDKLWDKFLIFKGRVPDIDPVREKEDQGLESEDRDQETEEGVEVEIEEDREKGVTEEGVAEAEIEGIEAEEGE